MRKICSSLTFFFLVNVVFAQISTIPFCNGQKTIEAGVGSRISLFKDYSDFQQAYLSSSNETYYLNIIYKIDGVFQFDRLEIGPDDIASICNQLALLSEKDAIDDNTSYLEARRLLIASSTIFSLAYYGWAIPTALNAEGNGKAYIASYMFVGGGGFFIPFLVTRNKRVTEGMAVGYTVGAGLGIIHGYTFTGVLMGSNFDDRVALGLGVGFSMAESMLGLSLAKRKNYTWERMSSIGNGGLWGAGLGALAPLAFYSPETINQNLLSLSIFSLSGAGMYAGNYLYERVETTKGDIIVMNSLGVLGAYYSFALAELFNVKNDKTYMKGFVIGSAAGVAIGVNRINKLNYSRQQGFLIATGELAGGLIGTGVGVLLDASFRGKVWLGALGATGGFLITDRILRPSKQVFEASAFDFNLQLNPYGLLGVFNQEVSIFKPWDPRYSNSLIGLNMQF